MKLFLPAVALTAVGCNGYMNAFGTRKPTSRTLYSSTTDDAFTAFADSLDEDPKKDDSLKSIEETWQAKLDGLLDPKTNLAERQILLSDLMNSNEAIQESVMDALANRRVGSDFRPLVCLFFSGDHRNLTHLFAFYPSFLLD
jgi:hypothetical protein